MDLTKMSPGQRSAIFALAAKAGLNNDALHDVAFKLTGKESISRLTHLQAGRLLDYLKRETGQDRPLGMLTEAQRAKIFALCREMGWTTKEGAVNLRRLEGFARRFGSEKLEWITIPQGGRIIEALKNMKDGGRNDRKGWDDG